MSSEGSELRFMDVELYLQRIGYDGPCVPTGDVLRQLHRAHLYAVPFENLDIHLGRPIVLSLPSLYEKIVHRRRGGFCYELNGLFGWLLRKVGFRLELLSGRVFTGGREGPEFDHMLLLVDVGHKLVADVGFGDSFVEPIPLGGEEQVQCGHSYRVVEKEAGWVLYRRIPEWEPQYVFSLKPRQLGEFRAMCRYQQTSPNSVFTKKSVCSRATQNGRITLSNDRLIVTSEGQRQDRKVAGAEEYHTLLREYFGIDVALRPAGFSHGS